MPNITAGPADPAGNIAGIAVFHPVMVSRSKPTSPPTTTLGARGPGRPEPARWTHRVGGAINALILWSRALLFGHLRVKRRDDKRVEVVFAQTILAPQAARPPATRAEAAPTPPANADEAVMRSALADALGAEPTLRAALRALAYVEGRLAKRGLASLERVQADLLERALRQLSVLTTQRRQEGLLALENHLSKLLVRRGVRGHLLDDAAAEARAAAAPVVADARLSDFYRLSEEPPRAKPQAPRLSDASA
jgi:hypothetical protein